MKNNSFYLTSHSVDSFSPGNLYHTNERTNPTIGSIGSQNNIKNKSYLSNILNSYKSPTQKSAYSSINRKNPLFYSVSKPASNIENPNEKDTILTRKDDEKFNEFKKNLLEELKILKEANNMMRDRNKLIYKKSKLPENRWLMDFFSKRSKREIVEIEKNASNTDFDTTIKSKNHMKDDINSNNNDKSKTIDNFFPNSTKYDQSKNIYSSPKYTVSNGSSHSAKFDEYRSTKQIIQRTDPLQDQLNLISNSLDFDIKGFIKDLASYSRKLAFVKEELKPLKVDMKLYCYPQCKLLFDSNQVVKQTIETYIQTNEIPLDIKENIQDIVVVEELKENYENRENSENREIRENRDIREIGENREIKETRENREIRENTENRQIAQFCLNDIYEKAVKNVKSIKKKTKKVSIQSPEPKAIIIKEGDSISKSLIENSLNLLYESAIHQQNIEISHNDVNSNKLLIESSLNNIYDSAIREQQQKPKKKSYIIEKTLAQSYLDGLYDGVCQTKPKENITEIIDLKKVKLCSFSSFCMYDRYDKMIEGTFNELQGKLLWIYYKQKISSQL